MIAVLASHFDKAARALVAGWGARAALLTSDDLTAAGWRHYVGCEARPSASVGGRLLDPGEIDGVLVRLPAISELELQQIARPDRSYVAAEMTAFLLAWLSRLQCPVLNRPTPGCLAGPAWRPEQWARAAARAGLRTSPIKRRVIRGAVPRKTGAAVEGGEAAAVTVIGERWLGRVAADLASRAMLLARAAGVSMLVVHFDSPESDACFVSADPWADLSSPEVADALLNQFESSVS